MKEFKVLIILILCFSNLFAQKKHELYPLPLNKNSGKIVWERDVKLDSVPIDKMKMQILQWAATNNYTISNSMDNKSSAIFIMNGEFNYTKNNSTKKDKTGNFTLSLSIEPTSYSYSLGNVNITRRKLEYFYSKSEFDNSLKYAYKSVDTEMNNIINDLMLVFKKE